MFTYSKFLGPSSGILEVPMASVSLTNSTPSFKLDMILKDCSKEKSHSSSGIAVSGLGSAWFTLPSVDTLLPSDTTDLAPDFIKAPDLKYRKSLHNS